jgi:hypothetical protein
MGVFSRGEMKLWSLFFLSGLLASIVPIVAKANGVGAVTAAILTGVVAITSLVLLIVIADYMSR